MVRSVALKDAWVGRTTSKVFGLVLALVFGLASIAIRANGGNFIHFILDKQNAATAITKLTGNVMLTIPFWT
jgi:hypothetical protein